MDLGIAGRKALVLGASGGLGAASAAALVAEGVHVIGVARSLDRLAAPDGPGGFTAEALDLRDLGAVTALGEKLAAAGGVDILVNNGGGPPAGPAGSQSAAAWQDAFDLMAKPLFTLTGLLLPGMMARGWGRIITIGSSGIEQPIVNLGLSNGIRTAVAGWSKTLAAEVAPHGVTVNMVLPGRIATNRTASLDAGAAQRNGQSVAEVEKASKAQIPMGRYGDPAEFGAVVAFLASRQASYVTGSMVRVDGGLIKSL